MKKTTPFYTALALTGMLAVSGCALNKGNTGHQLVAEPDGISLRLAASVDRASAALETLAGDCFSGNGRAARITAQYLRQLGRAD